MVNYKEYEMLLAELRLLKQGNEWLSKRLEKANGLLADNKLGIFTYTETKEQRFQRQLNSVCERIKLRGKLAAENIRCMFNEHEVIEHKLPDDSIMRLTSGILFEKLKNDGSKV